MSRLDALIEELCPDGVVFKTLDELGYFYSGLNGKNRNDFSDGNQKFITYMNVYSNLAVNINIKDFVKIEEREKQNKVNYGDVLFTGSSETLDECGISSVLTKRTNEILYLNSFCFGFHFYDGDLLIPNFSKYLFRSDEVRKQIINASNGVTRFNVSKKKMGKLIIPVPPLPVQKEIVRILDQYSAVELELEAQLDAELQAREKQYAYYRNALLDFSPDKPRIGSKHSRLNKLIETLCPDGIEHSSLGDCCVILDNLRKPVTKKDRFGGIYPYYGANGIQDYVKDYLFEGTFLLMGEDGSVINKDNSPVLSWAEGRIWVNNHAHVLSETSKASLRFIYYYLQTIDVSYIVRGVPPKITQQNMRNIEIPLPPLPVQKEIVRILDQFDALVHDLNQGLPAEISARHAQYEFYRDKLLTFKEKPA